MGRLFKSVDADLRAWIEAQPMFFVGTAPSGSEGHINISPKGGKGTARLLDDRKFAYLDLTGSGIETVAHLRENGRIVIMFCAFEGPPKILRFHGSGRVVQPEDPEFETVSSHFELTSDLQSLLRSIIVVDINRIADSCGFVVPRMDFVEEREHLFKWAERNARRHGEGWSTRYQQVNNRVSIDGLAGLDSEAEPDADEQELLSSDGRAL